MNCLNVMYTLGTRSNVRYRLVIILPVYDNTGQIIPNEGSDYSCILHMARWLDFVYEEEIAHSPHESLD